jgi:citrate lyase beta subunit
MDLTLPSDRVHELSAGLSEPARAYVDRYPGETGGRQPVHVVYGGAQLFRADTITRLGVRALEVLEQHAPDADTFADAIGLPRTMAATVYQRVTQKLRHEAVEDFRIDFEDGFGVRPDAEEDQAAVTTARETAAAHASARLPMFFGIRIKPFSVESRRRSMRTLDLYLTTLVRATGGALPPHVAIMLPKITYPEQVTLLAALLEHIESSAGLAPGVLKIELMIETPQSIFDAHGRVAPPTLVAAGRGRVVGVHFGTYDYTASLNITAAYQHMTHPACDFARHVMQVSLAGTGIWLSDGATNILPVGNDRQTIHRAWKLHYDHIRHSLEHAFYQGWDLHPAQLPTRYAAVYAFFLEGLEAAAARLRTFVERAAQATLVGDVFDDAATGQGLLNYFLRAINCGAVTEGDVIDRTGLTLEELRSRSFAAILKNRS